MEAPLPPGPSPREPPPPASLPPKMISARRDRQGKERSGEESDGDAEEKINAHPSAHGNYDKGYCALIASIDKGAKAAAGAALRRLHFRAGRQRASLPGPRSPVPKVIVMGSSTTSERTINTSTESANTILTNVTATDGDTTEDSLDRDGPAQDVLVSLDSAEGEPQRRRRRRRSPGERAAARIPEGASEADRTPEAVPIERRKSELPPRRDAASPGFRRASETRFPFDAGSFGDSRSVDDAPSVFDSDGGSPVRATRFAFDAPIATSPTEGRSRELLLVDFDSRERPPKSPKASNSKGEARFTFEGVGGDRRSVESRARKSSATPPPPPPDLRIDPPEGGTPAGGELDAPEPSEAGSPSARPAGAKGRLGSVDVNVTTNPLDNGSGCCNLTCPAYSDGQYACCACCSNDLSRNPNRKIPQATIVVQQASLSLDYSCVSTVLLGDEPSPSPSGRRPSAKRKKQRDDRMKRLLDATDRLTREEIRDFEMRYGSPHHSRSQSVKTGTRGLLGPPPQRARVASMPSTGVEEQYYRLRHFSITGKGVVNRGDSLKSRRSRSNTSVASSNSSTEHLTPRASAPPSLGSSRESSASAPPPAPYRVLVLGAPGVGKSSLISQFMTSEYLHAYDTSIDDDSGEKSVSVLLAGEESELVFVDQTCNVGPEADIDGPEPHAYCVVYSTADRGSLRTAEGWLRTLRSKRPNRARILVGNKADLVRSRAVSPDEGKSLAINYDCKFIETSVGINHNVDELLVGLLTQIRLKQEHPERTRRRGGSSAQNSPRKQRGARLSASLKVRGLLGRVWARDSKSKSCENLHVL